MGALPLQCMTSDSWHSLGLNVCETLDVQLADEIRPPSDTLLVITGTDGTCRALTVALRVDTAIEADDHRHGGTPTFDLRQLLAVLGGVLGECCRSFLYLNGDSLLCGPGGLSPPAPTHESE